MIVDRTWILPGFQQREYGSIGLLELLFELEYDESLYD